MNYTNILKELENATSFDLYRLMVGIEQQLEKPERIQLIKGRLRPGLEITYFDSSENRLVEATVLELNRTRMLVQNKVDGKRWFIRYCSVNLEHVDTDIEPAAQGKGLDRSQLHVGDLVGFYDRQNQIKTGAIISLNQKTASIMVGGRDRWRVHYGYLFHVIQGETVGPRLAAPREDEGTDGIGL